MLNLVLNSPVDFEAFSRIGAGLGQINERDRIFVLLK
jgi:hypothetical protein